MTRCNWIIMTMVAGLAACAPMTGTLPATGGPGVHADRIEQASAVEDGMGAVLISIRSEIFLDEPLEVFFLREGGDIANRSDVAVFERRQGAFALKNDTAGYRPRAYELAPGTYRLVAHGMDCDAVPRVEERCLVERRIMGRLHRLSRPSRGYGPVAPTFEIRSDTITYAGDFALTGRNKIEWSPIPESELDDVSAAFAGMAIGPEPVVPNSFALKYPLVPRRYTSDLDRSY